MSPEEVYELLSPREREVLELSGLPYAMIAEQLGISARTVEAHTLRISEKMPPEMRQRMTPQTAVNVLRVMVRRPSNVTG